MTERSLPLPRVAVIVLSYNGWRFLPTCLQALAATDYPADRLEIVVVDNASQDQTVEHVRAEFPDVRVLALRRNSGFAGGNNAGIAAVCASRTPPDYIVLLNNDTAVEPGWLQPLVRAAESDPQIGACAAKLLFFHQKLPLTMRVEGGFVPARDLPGNGDTRTLGVRLQSAELAQSAAEAPIAYPEGWYAQEGAGDAAYRWSSDCAVLEIPVSHPDSPIDVKLRFAGGPPDPLPPARVRLFAGDMLLRSVEVGRDPVTVPVRVPREITRTARRIVQNAGQELLPGGYTRDRGSYVEDGVERHAPDGTFERQEAVFGFCGAAVLLRRTMLDQIGLLDDRFFMYYEDIDLSWRARAAGWQIVYVPGAVVRHVHSGSSGAWSPFFRFHVERNRLLLLVKNAPASIARSQIGAYARETLRWIGRSARAVPHGPASVRASLAYVRNNLRVLLSLLRLLPYALWQRRTIRRRARVDDATILRWTV